MDQLPLELVSEIRRYVFGSDWKTVGDYEGLPCHFCWFKAAKNNLTYAVCDSCLTESDIRIKPRHFSELKQSYAIQHIVCLRAMAASGAEYFEKYIRSHEIMADICNELELRAMLVDEIQQRETISAIATMH